MRAAHPGARDRPRPSPFSAEIRKTSSNTPSALSFSTSGSRSVRFMPSILLSTSAALALAVLQAFDDRVGVARRHGRSALATRSAASTIRSTASASSAPAQAALTMARSRRRRGLKMPGVSTNTIWVSPAHGDAAHRHARGLHLGGDDGDLGADQRIDQRGFAGIGRADDGGETAARASCASLHRLASIAPAASCSASRLEPPSPACRLMARAPAPRPRSAAHDRGLRARIRL